MLPISAISTESPDASVSGSLQLRSSSSPWVRFTWKIANIPAFSAGGFSDAIRPAAKEESQKVIEVILNSLSMDSAWNGSFAKVESYLKDAVTRLFSKDQPLCLVIPKGNRLIAASLLDPTTESSSHLVSGPVVLSEYRNRGLGSGLLHASLTALRDRELTVVNGVTRASTIGARHVYTKFGGVSESVHFPFFTDDSQETKTKQGIA